MKRRGRSKNALISGLYPGNSARSNDMPISCLHPDGETTIALPRHIRRLTFILDSIIIIKIRIFDMDVLIESFVSFSRRLPLAGLPVFIRAGFQTVSFQLKVLSNSNVL